MAKRDWMLRPALVLYALLWGLLLPLVLLYLWRRGRRDPDYSSHLAERFGFYGRALPQQAIWLHCVSLGELRSASPLIRLLLARHDPVIVTCFTPAGRREVLRQFSPEISAGQLAVVWVPFDMHWCFRRFFRACRPRIGLTFEIEIWPAMVFAARRAGVPFYMCNAQYPRRSMVRDAKGFGLRPAVMRAFSGGFVKSDLQADRFRSIGMHNIVVTGELRFDQPVPPGLTAAAARLRPGLTAGGRQIVTIASGTEGEEAIWRELIATRAADARAAGRPVPLTVYVPRSPERFDAVWAGLTAAGITTLRRSVVLDAALHETAPVAGAEVLLGDSLGEMFFYLALADRVVVGAGFTPSGAHNIIEPLLVGKPSLTGPETWPIEFPFLEAEAAGVARSLADPQALIAALDARDVVEPAAIADFLAGQIGASNRTLAAMDAVLRARNPG